MQAGTRFVKVLGVVAACLTWSVAGASSARAADFVVTSLADNDGASCEADCTLRQAINASNRLAGADTITFSIAGTIRLTRDLPYLDTEMTIRNTQSATVTVSGDVNNNRMQDTGDVRVFGLTDRGNVTIDGLIISGGFASANGNIGGGINNDGILTLTNSTLASNKAGFGGGIYSIGTLIVRDCIFAGNVSTIVGGGIGISDSGRATIERSQLSNNSAVVGGGIFNDGRLTLIESVLTGNKASKGGGIFSKSASTLLNSELRWNTARDDGGGIFHDDFDRRIPGIMEIDNTKIVGNVANSGGGIQSSGTLKLKNSTVQGNKSGSAGGGVRNLGSMTIERSTIRENVAVTDGGGIAAGDKFITLGDDEIRVGGTLTISDSLLFKNRASRFGGGIAGASSLQGNGFIRLGNSTLSGNEATSGGGIVVLSGRLDLASCTITANRAPSNRGSGIGADVVDTQVRLSNSIVAENPGPGSGGTDIDTVFGDAAVRNAFDSGGYNLIGSGNATDNFRQNGDLVGISDAKIGPLSDNGGPILTHRPELLSPAVNGGNPAVSSGNTFDQRGSDFLRVRAGRLDIGAVELQLDKPPTAAGAAIDDNYTLVFGAPDQAQQTGVTLQSSGIFLVAAPGLLANDFNRSSSAPTTRLAKSPQHGRIQVRADGSFFYLPNGSFVGSDDFVYSLSNGSDATQATVRLNIVDRRAPELRFDTPPDRARFYAVSIIRGRVRDKQSGVKSVTVLWKRFDGAYWNGSAWTNDAVELPTEVQGVNWAYQGNVPVPGTDPNRNLVDGDYELTATATDNSGNTNQMTNRIVVKNQTVPTASDVRLSGAFTRETLGLIQLNFTGALDATTAGDKDNYRVIVNGTVANIGLVNYTNPAVTLGNFDLKTGDKVTLQIADLRDASGKTIAGGTIQLVAR